MAIDPSEGREKEQSKAVSWLWRWLSCALVLAVVMGSFAVGAAMTFGTIILLKSGGYWPSQINTTAAGEGGGVLFGLLPTYLIFNFIWSRRERRRVGFDVKSGTEVSGSSSNATISAEPSNPTVQASHHDKK